ncbi:MAG TPA: hypothetical protein VGM75_08680 [Pseudonocardiaceae bacterium]
MTRPEVPDSPPIDFTVYGLRASWPAARWFEFFYGQLGKPTYGVRFAYQAAGAFVSVCTLFRPRFDRECVSPRADRITEVAFHGTLHLIDLTLPEPEVPRLPGMNLAVVKQAERAAALAVHWPSVTWTVRETSVHAVSWEFAGGWTAFCDALPDVYLTATGWGVEPDGLEFAVIDDGAPYGIDLAAPLAFDVLPAARAAAGPPDHSGPNPAGYHPDQLALPR